MATDDYLLDDVERSQRNQTRRRREGRSRRRRVFLLLALAIVALVILSAPSFLSHSPMGKSMVADAVSQYGIDAEIESFSVGWITPLSISGVHLKGQAAGSEIVINEVDTGMAVMDLMSASAADFGEVVIRGVSVNCSVDNGRSSLEDDLQILMQPSDEPAGATNGSIEIQDATINVTDVQTGATWQVSKSNATVQLDAESAKTTFAGVLYEPGGGGGALQGSAQYALKPAGNGSPSWKVNLDSESLPLSVVSLVSRRFPAETASMPQNVSGDATGSIQATGYTDGSIEANVRSLRVRNLHATEPTPSNPQPGTRLRSWNNSLASLNGTLILAGDRVIGRGLTAKADFASATLDGAFSSSMTLVGANNNPLRWLEALDGTAFAEVDLARMDQALPGLLPLRNEAQIVSGLASARINSQPLQNGRRSQLTIKNEALRARSRGRNVVIEPVEINATVLDAGGKVRAEKFELTSSFASAIGKGDLSNGSADFRIDFGRLSNMLRPIVDMSNTSLGGTANGQVRWNATDNNLWNLDGSTNATNLLITLPSGQSLKRNTLNATVKAVGRWGGQSLDELSSAKVVVNSSGLILETELTSPVRNPSSTTMLPMRIAGRGEIENLTETLGPWLPAELHDATGAFELNSFAEVSSAAALIQNTKISLIDPRVAYGDRWFNQPTINIDFDGDFAWPSYGLRSRSLTVIGNAFTMRMVGEANLDNVDLNVAWQAKLERIQGSVQKRIAQWPGANQRLGRQGINVQTVGFRRPTSQPSVQTDDWLVTGDCKGNFSVKSNNGFLDITSDTTGTNISIVQPYNASVQSQTVGPMPRQTQFGQQFATSGQSTSRVVWSEPNLRVNGLTRYETATGRVLADGLQLAGDWFATTLSGHALWNEQTGDIVLKGPSRLKMDEISKRLTTLSGTNINVQGIHETPLEIHAARDAKNNVAFTVQGNLGWDLGEIAGVQFGNANVPVRLTETTIEISPAIVPVGQGQVNLAGEVIYRPGSIWLRAQPGTVAQNLRLTPEMTNRWMKYLAPLAADAAQVDGTMSIELDEAIVVMDTPELTRVKGRINIDGARMTAGPLSAQIISGLDQLKSLAKFDSDTLKPRDDTTLLTMPAQTIDFTLQQGVVSHERLFFDVDRAQIMTSGQVSLDTRVNMTAQVELDERWLGSDLKGLAGQGVSLPIRGTLSRPSLDASGIRDVVAKLGTQAVGNVVQETAENYIQKQLNKNLKSINKIFNR